MPPRSILDLEEAQRRLQQITEDRETLVNLITKLNAIYGKAESSLMAH